MFYVIIRLVSDPCFFRLAGWLSHCVDPTRGRRAAFVVLQGGYSIVPHVST